MANIDVSQIDGYSEMSAEDKVKALESLNLPEPDYSGYVKKDIYDKTASELATKKKELTEYMSEEEAQKVKDQEDREKLQKNYDALLQEVTESKHEKRFLTLGYSESLASDSAKALTSGDYDKVFEDMKKHLTAFEKQIRAELLKDTPKPLGDDKSTAMTKAEFKKLGFNERQEFMKTHPDEYKEFYKEE